MYRWQTNGSISWKDQYATVEPDLILSASGGEWSAAYGTFGPSGSNTWSLLGIINELVTMIGAIPLGRFWMDPVDKQSLSEPLAVTLGDRYLIPGVATSGANWFSGAQGPGGGPVENCVAEVTSTGPTVWSYWGDPAVWSGAQTHDLVNGACLWDVFTDSEWIYSGDSIPPAWIQCGGTTLEKEIIYGTSGSKSLGYDNNDRGATHLAQASGTTTFVLPLATGSSYTTGVTYRIFKDVDTEDGNVDISCLTGTGNPDVILVPSKYLYLDDAPNSTLQAYRKIRLRDRFDYVDLLATKYGWYVVGGHGVLVDQSPLHTIGTCALLSTSYDEIKLQVGASADDHDYNGRLIYIKGGTNEGQIRRIISYNGTTRVAQVTPPFTAMCDTDSEYVMVRYDDYYLGFGSIDTIYPNADQNAYVMDSREEGLFTGLATYLNYPTLARLHGQNTAEAFGGLLLGYKGAVKNQANFSSVFGSNGVSRWDSQFVFGGVNQAANQEEQTSRILLYGVPKAGGTPSSLTLGSGYGKNTLTMPSNRLYYITFSIAARYDDLAVAKYISWSGSVLAVCSAGTASLVALSKNITETGNSNSPALELDIDTLGAVVRFMATNNEALDKVSFVGFADIIEVYVPSPA